MSSSILPARDFCELGAIYKISSRLTSLVTPWGYVLIMKKKILFIVSSAKQIGPKKRPTGNFLTETAHPYVTFRRQGYDVDIYSIKGGEAPLDGMADKNNELNQIFLNGEGMAQMMVT